MYNKWNYLGTGLFAFGKIFNLYMYEYKYIILYEQLYWSLRYLQ